MVHSCRVMSTTLVVVFCLFLMMINLSMHSSSLCINHRMRGKTDAASCTTGQFLISQFPFIWIPSNYEICCLHTFYFQRMMVLLDKQSLFNYLNTFFFIQNLNLKCKGKICPQFDILNTLHAGLIPSPTLKQGAPIFLSIKVSVRCLWYESCTNYCSTLNIALLCHFDGSKPRETWRVKTTASQSDSMTSKGHQDSVPDHIFS